MFEKHFKFVVPTVLTKKLFETKDKKKNSELVGEIKNRWSNLKYEIKKMSEDEKKLNNQIKYYKLLKKFLILIKKFKNNQDKN